MGTTELSTELSTAQRNARVEELAWNATAAVLAAETALVPEDRARLREEALELAYEALGLATTDRTRSAIQTFISYVSAPMGAPS